MYVIHAEVLCVGLAAGGEQHLVRLLGEGLFPAALRFPASQKTPSCQHHVACCQNSGRDDVGGCLLW